MFVCTGARDKLLKQRKEAFQSREKVNRLTKSYGNVKAVNEISCTIEPNKIYGLLGRNGSGKTTLMVLYS